MNGLTDVLLEAARGALRLRVEGRSTARGSVPSWLSDAADFDIIRISEGSTVLSLEAPVLAEAAPVQFQQQMLFHPIDPEQTALDLMQESLAEAISGRTDSEIVDQALLRTFGKFRKTMALGFSVIQITSDTKTAHPLEIDAESVRQVETLLSSTPEPQRTRVAGKLDTIRHSDRMFTLVLEDGTSLKGLAEGVAASQLGGLFGESVVVWGSVSFRPSGKTLRIDADVIEQAGSDFSIWSHAPEPLFQVMDNAALHQRQGPRSGASAIFGRWPGDESDEAVDAALAGLS